MIDNVCGRGVGGACVAASNDVWRYDGCSWHAAGQKSRNKLEVSNNKGNSNKPDRVQCIPVAAGRNRPVL